jgi:hypothetical protein
VFFKAEIRYQNSLYFFWAPMTKQSRKTPTVADHESSDERVPIIRWSRLAIGGGMIVAAIVLIVIENHFGMVATPPPTAAPASPAARLPSMATPIIVRGLAIEPKFIGRLTSVGILSAAPGTIYLLAAIRVQNRASSQAAPAVADFSIAPDGKKPVVAQPYPGRPDTLGGRALKPGSSVESVVIFAVPSTEHSFELTYHNRDERGPATAVWRLTTG